MRIDTNGYNATVGQSLAHDPALGGTADGGLTKSGASTLTLTGSSTFTAPTTVGAGTLVLQAPAGSRALAATSAVQVNQGGTLLLASSATRSTTRCPSR